MELPKSLTDSAFESFCKRGAVIRFLMLDPDDPAVEERNKYAIILNVDPSDAETLVVLTTSQVQWFATARQWIKEAVLTLSAGAYPWVTKETVIDLRVVRSYALQGFKAAYQAGRLTFHDRLSQADLDLVNDKLRNSRTLTGAMLKRVVS